MIITDTDRKMLGMIKCGEISAFTTADKYPDKNKYWALVGMMDLIDISERRENEMDIEKDTR